MNAYQEEILKAVDNLAAEIARVQHAVEKAFPVSVEKPTVDEVVTYEGQPYKLVDRLAQVGDVILMTGDTTSLAVEKGCLYEVAKGKNTITSNLRVRTKMGYRDLYSAAHNRTPETVKVYAPTTWEDVQYDHLLTNDTPNERRAELIERAKQFHAEQRMQHNIHIGIYKNERKVEARCVQQDGSYNIGTAVIEKDAVFNLDIAKAIAVGRALDIDVSEFANAVQPTEIVAGTVAKHVLGDDCDSIYVFDSVYEGNVYDMTDVYGSQYRRFRLTDCAEKFYVIIDDTHAQY